MWVEKFGIMEVTNHQTGDKCIINFKPAGWFGKDIHWVEGYVIDKHRQQHYIIRGKWTEQLWSYPVNSQESLARNSTFKNSVKEVTLGTNKVFRGVTNNPRARRKMSQRGGVCGKVDNCPPLPVSMLVTPLFLNLFPRKGALCTHLCGTSND